MSYSYISIDNRFHACRLQKQRIGLCLWRGLPFGTVSATMKKM